MQLPQQQPSRPPISASLSTSVCLIDGTNISVRTAMHETIADLKRRISPKRGLVMQFLPERQILLRNTINLDSMKAISHYKISSGQTLNLIDVHSQSITHKTLAGRTLYLTYDGCESVAEFMQMIHFVEGTPPDQQCLNFKWLEFETELDLRYWTEYPFKQYDGESILLLEYDLLVVEFMVKDLAGNTSHVPIHL